MNKNQVFIGLLCILILFFCIGNVSAANLTVEEVCLASSGVKNYTEANNNKLPNHVVVSDKNSTMPSFLRTLTTTTVQLNSGVTTPVNITNVNNPTGPSGTATGIVYKSEYVQIANNINNFINNNGAAPNFASSSRGNIRYESLVYMYSRIVNWYYVNGELPNYVTVVHCNGVNSNGVVIDNVPPSVTNSLAPGTYNSLKNVTLTANDNHDPNPKVYYSLDNGVTWSNQIKTVTLNLNVGVTNLKYYGRDAAGNQGTTQTATYTINTNSTAPKSFTIDELEHASISVLTYIESNKQLPPYVAINGTMVNMAQFLKLASKAILNINNGTNSLIYLENYTTPLNSSETIIENLNVNKLDYVNLSSNIIDYMDSSGQAPNYRTINLENIRYESLVYTFAQILGSKQMTGKLPNYITIRPWILVENNSTVFITMSQISYLADNLKLYIETNREIPSDITICNSIVSMPQLLKLEVDYLINVHNYLYQSIVLQNYDTAPNPYESITGGNLNYEDCLTGASNIKTFMEINKYAPNYFASIRGYIRYESLIYIYAELINSVERNNYLPDYITLKPWSTVTNNNTVFITMDQVNAAVWGVQNYVETYNALPSSVTISGRQISMPQFLNLEIKSLKNIQAGLYQSIILQNYNTAPNPSETLTSGKISYENYINSVDTVISFMNDNGRAPNFTWTSQGNMRYESLVHMYAQILNYYNVNKALPQYVTVNPWTVVSNPNTVSYNTGQIISAAETVKSHVETNNALPTSVNISGTPVSMPQFLKLLTTTLHNINGTYAGQIVLGSYNPPTSTSETITGGTLNKTQYLDLARSVEFFMYGDLRAPNFQNSSLGNIRYQSLIYMYSQILSSYKANNYTLPDFITVRPWSVVSNSNTKFITTDQIKNASETVKSYIETNNTLPSSVTIANTQVSMPQFLKLLTTSISNINGQLNATIVLQNYNSAPNPSETITGGILNSTNYLNIANNIISFMDSNGHAPNFAYSSLGNIRYESLIYQYSLIMGYYSNKTELPQNVTVTPWSVVSNQSTVFFTNDQVESAAKTVQAYVETNHQLPTNVIINGTTVTMPQFLQLATTALLNIDRSLYSSIALKSYNTATNPSETINNSGDITYTDYIEFANDINTYMRINGKAPDFITTKLGTMRYESLVYMYSQILSSYNATSTLAEFITVNPWSTVSNSSTIFITTDQIKNASETVKSYIDTNHTLPSSVNISGNDISMPQFLKLAAKSIINIQNYLNISIILDNVGEPTDSIENITVGTITSYEFVDIANKITSFMNSNGTAPSNISDISLGSNIGYESLVYMFSKIMISYNATEHAWGSISVSPWVALSNPDGTFNFRSQKMFNSIQDAIDDDDTISGDTLWLRKDKYLENVFINKKIIIRPIFGVDVSINALNSNLPIFTINIGGNGTTIQDLIINGSMENVGIYINNSIENQILGNNITNTSDGIYLYNTTKNLISGNNIKNNSGNGLLINTGSDNEISSNIITSNGFAGISIQNSDKNKIYSNILTNNQDGIYLNNSSTEIQYNQIAGNIRYGLYNQGNGTINATNNWWGTNNPIVSSASPSDINIDSGTVTYNPWLVLTLNSSTDRSDRNGSNYNYIITADLTHNNQGNDTSSEDTLPDDILIYFNSTIGTINTSGPIKKGKVELKLTSSSVGIANVSATLNNQTVSANLHITSLDVLGIYNNRNNISFTSIQSAIDDPYTQNGDTLILAEGTYTENIVVHKRLIIKPAAGADVTIKSNEDFKNIFTIVNGGSGSSIEGMNIIGSGDSYAIVLSQSFNTNIYDNTISSNNKGIYLYDSGENILSNNIIKESKHGICLYGATSNIIFGNKLQCNEIGITSKISNENVIYGNIITDNYHGFNFQHSKNNVTGNNFTDNWVGLYLYDSHGTQIIRNNFSNNGAGITCYDSKAIVTSGNTFFNNWMADTSIVNSGEMIMATTIYTCGPAALATILKNMGIYTTEFEMSELAGTDETGTSLYGLKTSALAKGASSVIGAKLTIDQLSSNNIVVLSIKGVNHYVVIQNVTNTTVYLFDPNLGNIEMTLTKFNELYLTSEDKGVALLINQQAPANITVLSDSEMQNIKGLWRLERYEYWTPGYYYFSTKTVTKTIHYPTLAFRYVPGYTIGGWIRIPGYYEPYIVMKKATIKIPIIVIKYQPPKKVIGYRYVPETSTKLNISQNKDYIGTLKHMSKFELLTSTPQTINNNRNPTQRPLVKTYWLNINRVAHTAMAFADVGIAFSSRGTFMTVPATTDPAVLGPLYVDRPYWKQDITVRDGFYLDPNAPGIKQGLQLMYYLNPDFIQYVVTNHV